MTSRRVYPGGFLCQLLPAELEGAFVPDLLSLADCDPSPQTAKPFGVRLASLDAHSQGRFGSSVRRYLIVESHFERYLGGWGRALGKAQRDFTDEITALGDLKSYLKAAAPSC